MKIKIFTDTNSILEDKNLSFSSENFELESDHKIKTKNQSLKISMKTADKIDKKTNGILKINHNKVTQENQLKSFRSKSKKKNIFRIKRELRSYVLSNYPIVKQIYYCSSKAQMIGILNKLNTYWKELLKVYLSRFFLLHVHLRRRKNAKDFIKFRQLFFEMIDDSSILERQNHVHNNLIKNLCKGIVNFLLVYFDFLRDSNAFKNSFQSC